jgi:prepilin-type N-terminal cleavage/methylation domain-containing protein
MSLLSSHFKSHTHVTFSGPRSGFGLMELMVSVSIILVVTSIIIARQNSFNGAVLLRSQAYEVALTAREVQLNAVSATSISGDFRELLGLHFDTNNDAVVRVFKDSVGGNGLYTSGEEFGKQGVLDDRFEVRSVRSVSGRAIVGTAVSVVFERPNFDARFFDSAGELTNASMVEIDIARRDSAGTGLDAVRILEITATGQITVKNPI